MPVQHAPHGGIAIAGQQFKGGEFIPGEVIARATPQEKAQLAGHQAVNPFDLPHPRAPEPLTKDERDALTYYQEAGHEAINDYLRGTSARARTGRGQGPNTEESKQMVAALDSAIAKSVLAEDTVVYRGSAGTGKARVGFTSVTTSREVAQRFADKHKGTVVRWVLPKGSHAASIPGNEDELLLPRNVRLGHVRFGLETTLTPILPKEPHAPDDIFTHAAIGYAAIYDEMRAAIDRVLRDAPSYDWIRLIDQVIDEYRPIIGSTLAETVVASYLAGGHAVAKLIPAGFDRSAFLPPVPPLPPIRHPAAGFLPPEPFIEFPIIETAARDLYSRRLMMKGQFEGLGREARRHAFTVADVAAMDTLGEIRDTLAQNVADGASLRGFRKAMRETLENSPLAPHRVENVYRTNVQTGFSRGMDAVLDHPFVADLFPYEEFVEIHDGRLCELCRTIARSGIQGTNIYRRDDPVLQKFTPPCHWMCRCGRNPLQASQAAAKGIKEAILWQETGRPPMQPVRVRWPTLDGEPLQLPKGWAA